MRERFLGFLQLVYNVRQAAESRRGRNRCCGDGVKRIASLAPHHYFDLNFFPSEQGPDDLHERTPSVQMPRASRGRVTLRVVFVRERRALPCRGSRLFESSYMSSMDLLD